MARITDLPRQMAQSFGTYAFQILQDEIAFRSTSSFALFPPRCCGILRLEPVKRSKNFPCLAPALLMPDQFLS